MKQKKIRLRIHKINANGCELTDDKAIKQSAVEFFQNLLALSYPELADPDLSLLQRLPPSELLMDLPKPPDADEVKRAVFDISTNSAPGPDGFSALFFQACWGIVGPDVVDAVRQLFGGTFLPRSFTATSFFKSTRGLWQGDPISPAIFVLAADYLSRLLDKLILGNKEMTFKATRGSIEISHLAYADDIIIFTQAAVNPLRRLRGCLDHYAEVSGQQINLDKSNFYIADANEGWTNTIQSEGGFSRGSSPFLYLGVPIYRGVKRTSMFLFLREKISARISGWAHRHLSFGGRLTLIKSTLEAIPLHILQAIEPTGGALKQLDQQIAQFFWGSTNEKKRTHWISWDQGKNSLWATYMMAKYCHKASPLTAKAMGRGSPTWKRILKARAQAQPHIRWVVGEGKMLFWDDLWLGELPLRELSLDDRGGPLERVADYITDGAWDESKLPILQAQAGLAQHIVQRIHDTPIISDGPDVPRWKLSPNGEFSLATTWETLRSQRPIVQGLNDIWRAGLTSSIAIFIWRLLSNRIPMDTKLQWRRMELASKCQCCPHRPRIESLQHLFIQGDEARGIWREFDAWFEGSSSPLRINDTIPDRLEVWAKRVRQSGRKHLSRALPYLILWFIWAERNRSRHQSVQFKPFNVV
ncbi:uncharacterized protein LOC121781465 [Salvia splendens]|uniref:uncharacterized protein LOC121781465 n=1 Tax=Salvia splendens TaxID=180675 RepID=UPI001C27B1FE|nr:uncharacterized protein LOC121781465 [Salvia splendens]